MTMEEAGRRYGIPMEVLREYERWGLCEAAKKVMGAWQYDDTDLERLSLIMTLHDIGFSPEEVETYMHLVLEGRETRKARIQMLDERRTDTLNEIHFRERQLDRLDYLRYQLRTAQRGEGERNKTSREVTE